MQVGDKYSVVNIRSYLSEEVGLGEDALIQILSEFSCNKNLDVERFLKKSAIEFTKKNQSVTYLVFDTESGFLLGYFAIAVKPLVIREDMVDGKMSNRAKNKIKRVSELGTSTQGYHLAAYLIAQLGKNYADNNEIEISGAELLELAWQIIKQTQKLVGGMVTFLETNDNERLISFYEHNGFQKFDTRQTSAKGSESYGLVQLLKLL